MAFKKCNQCGEIYELFSNFKALDYDMCPICNERMKVIQLVRSDLGIHDPIGI